MYLTKKIKVNPTPEQKEVLWILSERCRLIYNFALAERKKEWEENGNSISLYDQTKKLPPMKKEYPEYGWVNARVLEGVLKKLDYDYKSFYGLCKNGDKDARPPHFKGKKYFTTMTLKEAPDRHR